MRWSSNPGGLAAVAELDRHVLRAAPACRPRRRGPGGLAGDLESGSSALRARQVDEQRVAVLGRPILDRVPARGALLQMLERVIDGADFEHRRRLAQR